MPENGTSQGATLKARIGAAIGAEARIAPGGVISRSCGTTTLRYLRPCRLTILASAVMNMKDQQPMAHRLHETSAAWTREHLIRRVLRRMVLPFLRIQFAPARVLAGSFTPQLAMRPQPWRWPCFSNLSPLSGRIVPHLPCARISHSHATCGPDVPGSSHP